MKPIVLGTNNKDKLRELQSLLKGAKIRVRSLADFSACREASEDGRTFEANARKKARLYSGCTKSLVLADDSGLMVHALNGRPGVYSARYADEERSAEKNIAKVLSEMKNIKHRIAYFKTIISLIINHKEYLFEGKVQGTISTEIKGKKGFGYDPIFIPLLPSPQDNRAGSEGWERSSGLGMRSFAEMTLEEKNKISHRAIAVNKLAEFLNSLNK